MYSLVNLIDEKLVDCDFINWKQSKPSDFFNNFVFPNYRVNEHKMQDLQGRQVNSFNRSQTLHSHQLHQNFSYGGPQERERLQTRDLSSKQFSKTIDTSVKMEGIG